MPKYLYRYRAIHDKFESLKKISTQNLWYCGSRADFDDQFDCVVPGVAIDRGYLERLAPQSEGRLSDYWRDRIDAIALDPKAGDRVAADVQRDIDGVGMLCLSELDDEPELWRLYGGDGRGVCLQLDMTETAADERWGLRGPFQIRYTDDPKHLWCPSTDRDRRVEQAEEHLLQKSTIWEHQGEWRFILHDGEKKTVGEYSMPVHALTAVILGRRLTVAECREITTWIRSGPWNPMPRLYCREPAQTGHLL